MIDRFVNAAVLTAAIVVLLGSESTSPPPADASSPIVDTVAIPTVTPKIETTPIPNIVPPAAPIIHPIISKPAVEVEAKAVPTSLRGDCANGVCERPARAAVKGPVNVVRGLRGHVSERRDARREGGRGPLRRLFGRGRRG